MIRFTAGQKIHLIGIGGVGMSAIARVLLEQGCIVSGSDRSPGSLALALAREGVTVYTGHDASHVGAADAVLITSAASADNPEVVAARARGIPVYKRADIIAGLMAERCVIAVAGAHGKTTTTAMIAHILLQTNADPGYIIGGTLKSNGRSAAAGSGPVFVVEADEYDHMFLGLCPEIAVVTNVEWDHPDFFPTYAAFAEAFERFVDRLPPTGTLIACADDPGAHELAARAALQGRPVIEYGLSAGAARLVDVRTGIEGTAFTARLPDRGSTVVRLPLPGVHNARNAMAALLAAGMQGVEPEAAAEALATFTGTSRRFDLLGEVNGVAVIDDYAHNPTKIRAAIAAARQRYPERTLWAVWQPHTYSRTARFKREYQAAFSEADHVLVTTIYAAREAPLPGVTAADVTAGIDHPDARHLPTFDEVVAVLRDEAQPPAVILIMSAGDATAIGAAYLEGRRSHA